MEKNFKNNSSETITHNIRVIVSPEFVANEKPTFTDKEYLFAYRIEIKNLGEQTMQLVSRHWIIINSEGGTEEIKGTGVVGYTPILKSGDTFTYTSFCPLDTKWGTMEGSFSFVNIFGEEFEVKVGRFYLVSNID